MSKFIVSYFFVFHCDSFRFNAIIYGNVHTVWENQSLVNLCVFWSNSSESSHFPLNRTKGVTDCCLWCICERLDLKKKKKVTTEESKTGIKNIIITNRIVRRKIGVECGITSSAHHYGREAERQREKERTFFGFAEWQQKHIHKYIADCMGKKMKKGMKNAVLFAHQTTEYQSPQHKDTLKVYTHLDFGYRNYRCMLIWDGMPRQNRYFQKSIWTAACDWQ